jgi:hypothetical protein
MEKRVTDKIGEQIGEYKGDEEQEKMNKNNDVV